MNIRRFSAVLIAAVITMLLFCSCGTAYHKTAGDYSWEDDSVSESWDYGWDGVLSNDVAVAPEAPESSASPQTPNSDAVEAPEEADEKIIKNGNLNIETLDFDAFISELEQSVSAFGGYVESCDRYGSKGYRTAYYSVRVPARSYDSFMKTLGDMGTVTSSSESVTNVTLQYIDIEARLSALVAERDSFQKLMDRAETIEEILKIQGYLTDVNYQIESYTTQLNSLRNKVSYSTVTIDVCEVARVTPPEPETVSERISTQLSENLYDISEGAKDFAVWFVSSLPYFAIYGVIIAVIVLICVKISKSARKKAEAREREFAKKYPGYAAPMNTAVQQPVVQQPKAANPPQEENKDNK